MTDDGGAVVAAGGRSLTSRLSDDGPALLRSVERRWKDWNLTDGDPPPASAERDVAMLEAALVPAPRKVLAVLLKQVLDLFAVPESGAARAAGCLEALADCPMDIATEGLRRVRMECTFYPLPAEVRRRVEVDLNARRRALAKARAALALSRRRPAPRAPMPELTPEQRAIVDATLARVAGSFPSARRSA